MFELIDITPGSVPTRKGIFRTKREVNLLILYICDADSEYRIDPYTPGPDDILFEIPGDDSGLLIEIPRDICGTKSKVNRIIKGEVVVLNRIEVPGT